MTPTLKLGDVTAAAPGLAQQALHLGPVLGPGGGPDDEPAHAPGKGRSDVRQDGVALAELEQHLGAGKGPGLVAGASGGHAEHGQGRSAPAGQRGLDRTAHTSVSGDDALHSDLR